MAGMPSQRSGRGREALPEGLEWSKGLSRGPGLVVSPILEVWQWSVGPPGGPGVVGRLSPKFWSGREALLKVWEWL